ncbi:GlcG/HbpS family heme-binding protein [Falsirhodobacter sp. 20TX0035]|uniref:GlcG/HbpS family heme-binding protein n=1 Tax=Falsirhodobacter sp. 20TX0035 TaxID=3022019 RepID=UPI00232CF925|nr:heme-binding protein [Falsirhodobacter sp. 20TX0035]MDB6455108.1 heme-binding protein [Falsirhodobacter sp. 20TX0035]
MKTVNQPSISHEAAQAVIAAAVQAGREREFPVSVAVVDRGGWLVAFSRADGGVPGGVDGAIGKAQSSAKFQDSLANFGQMARDGQTWLGDLPGMIPLGGGEPLMVDGVCVDAVAVSGANEPVEQACAEAGAAVLR